ncbi:MAG: hypothetical protein JRI34_02115, partial [Deltaproteobacteria bacterium]|nr:hypothetical protein [Deltaproteobacteria bacterium]
KPRVEKLEEALIAKERVIEALALEVRRQKEKVQKLEELLPKNRQAAEPGDAAQTPNRVSIRLGSSRTLLDQRLVVACLEINRDAKNARLQFNFLKENKVESVLIHLGQSVNFSLSGQQFIAILDQIHAASVSLQIMKKS